MGAYTLPRRGAEEIERERLSLLERVHARFLLVHLPSLLADPERSFRPPTTTFVFGRPG